LVRSSTSRLADETGSSLVEVSVAMVILVLAVVPLAGVLEAGLRAATSSGEYDAARALANERLEEVRALPYSRPGGGADSAVERYAPPGPPDATEGDLNVSVKTAFVERNLSDPAGSPPTGQMRVEVLVTWDAGSLSTVGVVSGEPP
jgi:Tfp pilus assembly protein PilV